MGKEDQDLLNNFYSIDNLITVNITMDANIWLNEILLADPAGGFGFTGKRYEPQHATSVTISGTKFPKQPGTFTDVGIIKKSFAGSFSREKPSIKLDFTKWGEANGPGIEALIGTKNLTLNNSIQDPAYIRQPLGYELFRQAGVPNFRCNYAKLIVNGTNMGVFVNLEPLKKRFIQQNFAGNDKGNAYEIELDNDIVTSTINADKLGFQGFSEFKKADLLVAADQIANQKLKGAQQVVEMDAFIKFFAMETLLKHWDGYTQQLNNTFIYNDVKAVANPTASDVKIKFIPSGIDQILQSNRNFLLGRKSVFGPLVLDDKTTRDKLITQIRTFANTIFSNENHDKVLKPFMDKLEAMVKSAGANPSDIAGPIGVVRDQVKSIRPGAFQLIGEKVPAKL